MARVRLGADGSGGDGIEESSIGRFCMLSEESNKGQEDWEPGK